MENKPLQIKLTNVSKRYQRQDILRDINLEIYQGDAIALLGPNGCGKSTLIKLIGQLSPATTGDVTHCVPLKIGYVASDFPDSLMTPQVLFEQLIAIDQLKEGRQKLLELSEKFGISRMLETPISYLSKGSKQKINVIQALLCQPDVLLLDEPLSGQDVGSQAYFIELVQGLNEAGVTIIMCCHEPFLTEALANDSYQIHEGQLELRERQQTKRTGQLYAVILLEPLEESQANAFKAEALESIQQMSLSETNCQLICRLEDSQKVLQLCLVYGFEVRRLTHEFI